MQQILLVEDDHTTSGWLAGLLAQIPGMRPPACCATAAEALAWLDGNKPDVVLVDLGLPDRPGADVIHAVAARYPACDILVITVFGDEGHVIEALSAGASGYLLKDASLANIREHLENLQLGGSPMSPRIARMLIRHYRNGRGDAYAPAGGSPGLVAVSAVVHGGAAQLSASSAGDGAAFAEADLSDREKNVLTGIAKGFTYGEVASALDISTNTVRTHIKRIYAKLAVNSRSEAVWEYNQREALRGRPPLG